MGRWCVATGAMGKRSLPVRTAVHVDPTRATKFARGTGLIPIQSPLGALVDSVVSDALNRWVQAPTLLMRGNGTTDERR